MRTARCAGQAARSSPARARSSALITRTRACWRASSSSGKQRRRSTMSRAMEKVMSSAQPSHGSQQTDLAEAVRGLVGVVEKQAERLGDLEVAIEKLGKEVSTHSSTQDSTQPSELRSLANAQSEMSKTLAEIAEAVRKRGRITFDMKELQRHVAGLLDQRLQRAVEAPVARLEKALGGRIDAVGAEAREAGERAEAASKQAARSVEASASSIEKSRKVGWPEVGNLAAALLPLLVAVTLVLGLGRVLVVDVLGLPVVTAWLWGQVSAASSWWAAGLWVLALVSVVGGTVALVAWASRRLYEWYQRW